MTEDFLNDMDLKAISKVIILDKKIAEALFKKEQAMGKYVQVGNVVFKVIGVNSKKERWGDGSAYIPFTTAQLMYNPDRKFRSIAFKVKGLETEAENNTFNDNLKGAHVKEFAIRPGRYTSIMDQKFSARLYSDHENLWWNYSFRLYYRHLHPDSRNCWSK